MRGRTKEARRTVGRALPWVIALLVWAVPPIGAQDAPPARGPAPEAIERLERVRMERMKRALDLTDEEAAAIRSRMKRHRTEMLRAMAEQREAMERLQRALHDEPVDQREVARALEAVERQRGRMRAMHDDHREQIGRDLTPEQRARMMLFNQRFEHRLRELMARHRAPRMDRPMPGRSPGARENHPRHRD